jgi:hypothetical protein
MARVLEARRRWRMSQGKGDVALLLLQRRLKLPLDVARDGVVEALLIVA